MAPNANPPSLSEAREKYERLRSLVSNKKFKEGAEEARQLIQSVNAFAGDIKRSSTLSAPPRTFHTPSSEKTVPTLAIGSLLCMLASAVELSPLEECKDIVPSLRHLPAWLDHCDSDGQRKHSEALERYLGMVYKRIAEMAGPNDGADENLSAVAESLFVIHGSYSNGSSLESFALSIGSSISAQARDKGLRTMIKVASNDAHWDDYTFASFVDNSFEASHAACEEALVKDVEGKQCQHKCSCISTLCAAGHAAIRSGLNSKIVQEKLRRVLSSPFDKFEMESSSRSGFSLIRALDPFRRAFQNHSQPKDSLNREAAQMFAELLKYVLSFAQAGEDTLRFLTKSMIGFFRSLCRRKLARLCPLRGSSGIADAAPVEEASFILLSSMAALVRRNSLQEKELDCFSKMAKRLERNIATEYWARKMFPVLYNSGIALYREGSYSASITFLEVAFATLCKHDNEPSRMCSCAGALLECATAAEVKLESILECALCAGAYAPLAEACAQKSLARRYVRFVCQNDVDDSMPFLCYRCEGLKCADVALLEASALEESQRGWSESGLRRRKEVLERARLSASKEGTAGTSRVYMADLVESGTLTEAMDALANAKRSVSGFQDLRGSQADCASETVVSADKVTIANACAAMWAIEGKFFDELPDHVERALEPWREDCHDITDVDASQMNEVHSCLATLADALAVSGLTELHAECSRVSGVIAQNEEKGAQSCHLQHSLSNVLASVPCFLPQKPHVEGLENIRIHTLDGKIENDNLDFAVAFVDEELRRIRSSARAYVIKRVPHPKGFPRDLEKWFYYGQYLELLAFGSRLKEMIGDSDGAICMYEEMIAIFDRLGIKNLANVARSREAQVYLQMDRVKKALEISRDAPVGTWTADLDRVLEAEHLIHAATLQRTEGESREMETFEKAIELLRQLYLSAGETAEPYVARWHGQALAQKGQALETDGEKQEALEAVVEGTFLLLLAQEGLEIMGFTARQNGKKSELASVQLPFDDKRDHLMGAMMVQLGRLLTPHKPLVGIQGARSVSQKLKRAEKIMHDGLQLLPSFSWKTSEAGARLAHLAAARNANKEATEVLQGSVGVSLAGQLAAAAWARRMYRGDDEGDDNKLIGLLRARVQSHTSSAKQIPVCTLTIADGTSSAYGSCGMPSLRISRAVEGGSSISVVVDDSDCSCGILALVQEVEAIKANSSEANHECNTARERKEWWRKRLEMDERLGEVISHLDVLLGPWRALLVGEPESSWNEWCTQQAQQILKGGRQSISDEALYAARSFLWAHALGAISREEALKGFGIIAGGRKQEVKNGAADVLDSVSEVADESARSSLVIVAEGRLGSMPWECIPGIREEKLFRMPSARCAKAFMQMRLRGESEGADDVQTIHSSNTYYLLNPSGDLPETQRSFESWFRKQGWEGAAGKPPDPNAHSRNLSTHELFLYFGHGHGQQYLPSHAFREVATCAASVLMGCSSGAILHQGAFEPKCAPFKYMTVGCPAVIANLWDVTDKDIDRFSATLLNEWLAYCHKAQSISKPVPKARNACRLPNLIGAAPVIYGLPVLLM